MAGNMKTVVLLCSAFVFVALLSIFKSPQSSELQSQSTHGFQKWLHETAQSKPTAHSQSLHLKERFQIVSLPQTSRKKIARFQKLVPAGTLSKLEFSTQYPIGKQIHGYLDVPAELDPADGATVPAIVIEKSLTSASSAGQDILANTDSAEGAEDSGNAAIPLPCYASTIVASAGCGSATTVLPAPVAPAITAPSVLPPIFAPPVYSPAAAPTFAAPPTLAAPPGAYRVAASAGAYQVAVPAGAYQVAAPAGAYQVAAGGDPNAFATYDAIPAGTAAPTDPATAAAVAAAGGGVGVPTFSAATPNLFRSPFRQWREEDAVQHAYNLAQWRVKLLQAKLRQAHLRSRLMQASLPPPPPPAEEGATAAGGGGGGSATAAQIRRVKEEMLQLARETVQALRHLRRPCCPTCPCAAAASAPAAAPAAAKSPTAPAPADGDWAAEFSRRYAAAAAAAAAAHAAAAQAAAGAAAAAVGGSAGILPAAAAAASASSSGAGRSSAKVAHEVSVLTTKVNDVLRVLGGRLPALRAAAAASPAAAAARPSPTAAAGEVSKQVARWKAAQALTSPAA